MKRAVLALSCFQLVACCCTADAATAPTQLYGKSINVSWTDNRMQREVGAPQFHPWSVQYQLKIYISSAGRPFIRNSMTSRGGSARGEQVGVAGTTSAGGARMAQFQGHSLVIVITFNGGARRVQIDFDGNFASCSASVILGKATGAGSYTTVSPISGRPIEIQSGAATAVTCATSDGNIFAE
jgi:hypothetical protein